jgi:SAM-dependent methyltransferase
MFSLEFLKVLRLAELEDVIARLPPGARLLEIGAGTGEQSAALTSAGFVVVAVDVATSNYRDDRVFDVQNYDGRSLPFPDRAFDVVYSSNVLEHVDDLEQLQGEFRRVLKPDGMCLHLMPTPAWRLWSGLTVFFSAGQAGFLVLRSLAGYRQTGKSYGMGIKWALRRLAGQCFEAVRQPCHGVRGNRLTELYYFSRRFWVPHFESNGFKIVEQGPGGLFYTGYMALGPRLAPQRRRALAQWLGSACNLYVVRLQPLQ